jgi:hypothetical protein
MGARVLVLAALVLGVAALTGPVVKVWDNVFAPDELVTLVDAGDQRQHSFTTVFDRETYPQGRTVFEAAVTSILDELDDSTRYVEYWWRGLWKGMKAHRDVDEALCRIERHAGTNVGVQRCPIHGHVLYLDVADAIHAPTCLWEEDVDVDLGRTTGTPRNLIRMHTVPARKGRLLRFRGDLLHAVPKPTMEWLQNDEPAATANSLARRSVLLFNVWDDHPQLPSPLDPPPAGALEELRGLSAPPSCKPSSDWDDSPLNIPELEARKGAVEGHVCLTIPLLGDLRRRGTEAPSLAAMASAAEVRKALASEVAPHTVPLHQNRDAPDHGGHLEGAATRSLGVNTEVDHAEELAVKIGYAEHLEEEFFLENDDGSEDQDDVEEGNAVSSDFWANMQALQALEEARARVQ